MPAVRVFVLPVTMSVVLCLLRDDACWPNCVYQPCGWMVAAGLIQTRCSL